MSNEPPSPALRAGVSGGLADASRCGDPPTRRPAAGSPPPSTRRRPPSRPQPPGQPPQPGPLRPPPQQPGPYGPPPQQPGPTVATPAAEPLRDPPAAAEQPLRTAARSPAGASRLAGHTRLRSSTTPRRGLARPGRAVRRRSGKQKSGKGWLIALLVVLALALVAAVVVAALILADDSEGGLAVEDIESGDCLVGSGLARRRRGDQRHRDGSAATTSTTPRCSPRSSSAATRTSTSRPVRACVDEAAEAGKPLEDLAADGLEIRPLVASRPARGG